jgi:hypothetical protein
MGPEIRRKQQAGDTLHTSQWEWQGGIRNMDGKHLRKELSLTALSEKLQSQPRTELTSEAMMNS